MSDSTSFLASELRSNCRPANRVEYSGLTSSQTRSKEDIAEYEPEKPVTLIIISSGQLPERCNISEHHFRDIYAKSRYLQRDGVESATWDHPVSVSERAEEG
jgi:hypothetical protein